MADTILGGASSTDKGTEYRLPTDVYPRHYELAFKTDLEASSPTFSGEALISIDVLNDTKALVFNHHDALKVTHLAIASTELKTTAAVQLPIKAFSLDKEQERGTIDLSSLPDGGLKAGSKVKLFMRWESDLGRNMVGYYESIGDEDKNGKKPK